MVSVECDLDSNILILEERNASGFDSTTAEKSFQKAIHSVVAVDNFVRNSSIQN